jgi:hypothetical protein
MAEPGEIVITGAVRGCVWNKIPIELVDLGERELRNIGRPVHVYRVVPRESMGYKGPVEPPFSALPPPSPAAAHPPGTPTPSPAATPFVYQESAIIRDLVQREDTQYRPAR